MITREDLQEAIAECEGERRPNASTCIKLAAFYTIREHLYGSDTTPSYSYASGATEQTYESGTEFGTAVSGRDLSSVMSVMDELMSTLSVVNPRLYKSVLRKLNE